MTCMRLVIGLSLILSILMVLAIGQTRLASLQYQTQEAHDAVQDQRLSNLESLSATGTMAIAEVRDKVNWILGGVAGFGALLTLLHVFQIRELKKGKP